MQKCRRYLSDFLEIVHRNAKAFAFDGPLSGDWARTNCIFASRRSRRSPYPLRLSRLLLPKSLFLYIMIIIISRGMNGGSIRNMHAFKYRFLTLAVIMLMAVVLAACGGQGGNAGANGAGGLPQMGPRTAEPRGMRRAETPEHRKDKPGRESTRTIKGSKWKSQRIRSGSCRSRIWATWRPWA